MSDYQIASSTLLDALRRAQSGDVVGAEQKVQSVRETWVVAASPELMVDLMIVEGVCGLYSGKSEYANDRIARALVVAKVSRRAECIYAASAWMAYLKVVEGDMRQAVDFLIAGCSERPVNVSPLAEFRCSSILAVLFEYFGVSNLAAGWFLCARFIASETGLPAALGSTIYNMAVARVNASYLAKIQSKELLGEAKCSLLLAQSASNYDEIRRIHMLDPFHHLIQAQALYLCGQFPMAIESVNRFLADSRDVSARFRARGEFDLLEYQNSSGVHPDITNLRRLQEILPTFKSNDDQAIVKYALANAFSIIGALDIASKLKTEVAFHLRLHRDICKSILSDLESAGFSLFPRAVN